MDLEGAGSSELLDSQEEEDLADISIHTAHLQETDVEKSDAVGSNIKKALKLS